MVIPGPYCLVCGGRNVIRERVWDITSWSQDGRQYGWVERDVCLDCRERQNVAMKEQDNDN